MLFCVKVDSFSLNHFACCAVDDGSRLRGGIDEEVIFPTQLPALRVELCSILPAEVEFFEREELLGHE